jgi:hypothetical protein
MARVSHDSLELLEDSKALKKGSSDQLFGKKFKKEMLDDIHTSKEMREVVGGNARGQKRSFFSRGARERPGQLQLQFPKTPAGPSKQFSESPLYV